MNIVVDKSTDQECRFIKLNMADEFVATLVGITVQLYFLKSIKLNMADEFVATLVGITVQLYFLKFQGHWLLVKSGTMYSVQYIHEFIIVSL